MSGLVQDAVQRASRWRPWRDSVSRDSNEAMQVGRRILALGFAMLLPAAAYGDTSGAAAFQPCGSCHTWEGERGRGKGPALDNLMGRLVAADRTFNYSPPMQAAGFAQEVWTAGRLDKFLSDPEAMFPGLWGDGHRVDDAAVRKALVDFIADPNSR